MKTRIVAITGGTGFIGKQLVKRHSDAGDIVRILSRKASLDINLDNNVEIFTGDLCDDQTNLKQFLHDVDILYHCAAEINDASNMGNVNINGTIKLINNAEGNVKHWVQLSSVGVYGPQYSGVITELNPTCPNNEYERTKTISDELVINAALQNKFTLTILRPSNVFGAGMRNSSLFALIKAVDNGIFFFIGPKNASANYICVENVAEALVLCGNHPQAKGKIYNISNWTTTEDFMKIVAKTLGKPFPKYRLPLNVALMAGKIGDLIKKFPLSTSRVHALTTRVLYSNDLIEKDLNYKSVIATEDAIVKFVKAYKKGITR